MANEYHKGAELTALNHDIKPKEFLQPESVSSQPAAASSISRLGIATANRLVASASGAKSKAEPAKTAGVLFPLTPTLSPREGERWHAAGKFECRSCSPRFFVFRFGSTRQPSSDVLPKHGRMFLSLLGERVGVRGNEANSNPKRTPIPGTSRVPRQSRGFPNLIMTDHRNRTTRRNGAAAPPQGDHG
jgi:hypothetical protein